MTSSTPSLALRLALACLVMDQAAAVAQVVEGSLTCLSLGTLINERVRPAISLDGRVVAFAVKEPAPVDFSRWPAPRDLVCVVELETGRADALPLELGGLRWSLGFFAELSLSHDGCRIAMNAARSSQADDSTMPGFEVGALLLEMGSRHARRLLVPDDLGFCGSRSPSLAASGRYAFVPTQPRPGQPLFETACLVRLDLDSGTADRLRADGELLQPLRWSASADASLVVMDGFRLNGRRGGTHAGLYAWRPGQASPEPLSILTEEGPPNDLASFPAVSADGKWLAFVSRASNLVPEDTNDADDVFLLELGPDRLQRVSIATDGRQVDNHVRGPLSISADGSFIAFQTHGQGLDPADHDQMQDAFVHDRLTGRTVRVNVSASGTTTGAFECGPPALSGDGSTVVFATRERLLPEDDNTSLDVYVRRLAWDEGSRR